jgi:hypothetical protein
MRMQIMNTWKKLIVSSVLAVVIIDGLAISAIHNVYVQNNSTVTVQTITLHIYDEFPNGDEFAKV